MSRQAVQQRVKKSAQLQAVLEDSKESLKDITENKLFDAIENGDPWAIQFGLRTFCRDRGYGDRKEISGPEGGPIDVRAVDYRQAVSPMLSDET